QAEDGIRDGHVTGVQTCALPILLQTGETADGKTPLIDRQHPHDLFMELATTYSVAIDEQSSVFAYFGYPGEPALGPATFMHRFRSEERRVGKEWRSWCWRDEG